MQVADVLFMLQTHREKEREREGGERERYILHSTKYNESSHTASVIRIYGPSIVHVNPIYRQCCTLLLKPLRSIRGQLRCLEQERVQGPINPKQIHNSAALKIGIFQEQKSCFRRNVDQEIKASGEIYYP